jgi:hypothetical protein
MLEENKRASSITGAGEDHDASPAYHPTWIEDDP